MEKLSFCLLLIFTILSCDNEDEYPSCLTPIISDLTAHHCDSTAHISKYRLKGDILFVIDPGRCWDHQAYDVLNSDCEVIGFLQGFSGNSMINGVDFYEQAKLISVIWHE